MSRCVVFVESNTTGTGRLFARTAAQLGFRPVLLAEEPSRYKYAAEDGIEVVKIATQDMSAVIATCERLRSTEGLAGITTSSDYFVVIAAEAARHFELPGPNPSALQSCRHKEKQYELLAKGSVLCPRTRGASTPGEAVEAARQLGFPVVLKPAMGSGSVGVRLCDTTAEVETHAALLLEQRTNERGMPIPQRVLVQECVQGPEFSVETFNLEAVGVTRKHLGAPPFFLEVGHDFPAGLSPEQDQAARTTAVNALKALGLGWGPAHIELRMSAAGPTIIEVNPRLAGGFIPNLVLRSTGIELISETVKQAVGMKASPSPTTNQHASIRFLVPERGGRWVSADNLEAARALPSVVEVSLYSQPGGVVAVRGDFRDRVGHILTCADSAEAARSAANRALSTIQLRIDPIAEPASASR